jgi:hypothetical protein
MSQLHHFKTRDGEYDVILNQAYKTDDSAWQSFNMLILGDLKSKLSIVRFDTTIVSSNNYHNGSNVNQPHQGIDPSLMIVFFMIPILSFTIALLYWFILKPIKKQFRNDPVNVKNDDNELYSAPVIAYFNEPSGKTQRTNSFRSGLMLGSEIIAKQFKQGIVDSKDEKGNQALMGLDIIELLSRKPRAGSLFASLNRTELLPTTIQRKKTPTILSKIGSLVGGNWDYSSEYLNDDSDASSFHSIGFVKPEYPVLPPLFNQDFDLVLCIENKERNLTANPQHTKNEQF